MTRFTNGKSCGRFGSDEHLAERDWVIGSEDKKCSKSHTRHGTRQKTKSSSEGVVDKDAKPQPGGRIQDFKDFRPNKEFPVCLAQRS